MDLEKKASKIDIIITDVDGVLTNGGIILDSSGLELKQFNVKDGQICSILKKNNIKYGVITGRKSPMVIKRCEELSFDFIYQGISDKVEILNDIKNKYKISYESIAYIGDDINDLGVIEKVGLSATPNDAFYYVREKSDYITSRNGGHGAFREFAELILKSKNINIV